MPTWIEVTDPASGKSIAWESMSPTSARRQARIEAERGACVRIIKGTTAYSADGKVVWSNHPTDKISA